MDPAKIAYVAKNSIFDNLQHVFKTNQDFNMENIPATSFTYRPFDISSVQSYNPYYSVFFPQLETERMQEISFHHRYHMFDLHTIVEINSNSQVVCKKSKDIFIKFSPLLDPIHYMTGKYNVQKLRNTPILPDGKNHESLPSKIREIHNASYVDNFFNFLSSSLLNQRGFVHGIDYYGSLFGVQKIYKMNVEDDLEYINNHIFFQKNNGKLFFIDNYISDSSPDNDGGEGGPVTKRVGVDSLAGDLEVVDIEVDDTFDSLPENNGNVCATPDIQPSIECELEEIYESTNTNKYKNWSNKSKTYSSSDSSYTSASSTSSNEEEEEGDDQEENTSPENGEEEGDVDMDMDVEDGENAGEEQENGEEDGDEDDEFYSTESSDGSEDSEDTKIHAYIKDFPVQMICLEKCEGTLDELFDNDLVNEEMGISVLFQIIMSLLTYQLAFDFTHNDLHTNNIMYVSTEHKYIFYKYENQIYRVPTYGKIFKMIDFGRAIYRYGPHTFCSDSFAEDGDANTQYNFGRFLNPKKPVVLPNKAFDLCRLGCSIYDFIIDKNADEPLDEFQTIIDEWCQDEEGKNLIYKKNGKDRYPGFKLYRVIAHKVFRHTPYNQLQRPAFQKYLWRGKIKSTSLIVNLDMITPCYFSSTSSPYYDPSKEEEESTALNP